MASDGTLPDLVRRQVLLLLTELVTNAVRHGGASAGRSVGVTVFRSADLVRIAVTDPGAGFDWRGRESEDPMTPGGYGLFLVEQTATRWGIERGSDSTTVWFEIDAV